MSKEKTTIPITGRIPLELFANVKNETEQTRQTMSDFIREAIEDKLLSNNNEMLESEINYMEKRMEILKKKRNTLKEKEKHLISIPKREVSFLIETKEMLETNPEFLEGRINLYKNTFGKINSISKREFFELLYEAEKQSKSVPIEPK